MAAPVFEVFPDAEGQYRWHLKAGNGEIVAQSESYPSRSNAERGVKDAVNAFLGMTGPKFLGSVVHIHEEGADD